LVIDNGLSAWEANAEFWDNFMGDESNGFHRNLVRPNVEKLLEATENDVVLDIACGNGNFSERLAGFGARVIAFDYSAKMIELAKKRRKSVLDKVEFHVCDAADSAALLRLIGNKPFDKAVANMAIMDIAEIEPLFKALSTMLKDGGAFVCATHHPCFTFPNDDYFTNCIDKGEAVEGQPVLHNYYHRTISDIFNIAFKNGFIVDGCYEVPFSGEKKPIIMVIRFRKNS